MREQLVQSSKQAPASPRPANSRVPARRCQQHALCFTARFPRREPSPKKPPAFSPSPCRSFSSSGPPGQRAGTHPLPAQQSTVRRHGELGGERRGWKTTALQLPHFYLAFFFKFTLAALTQAGLVLHSNSLVGMCSSFDFTAHPLVSCIAASLAAHPPC